MFSDDCLKSIINGEKRTFYTESGFNLVLSAFPPLSFSKKNVLGTRLGVIVVYVVTSSHSQSEWSI